MVPPEGLQIGREFIAEQVPAFLKANNTKLVKRMAGNDDE